nr:uncharacterized mitochondrial protein AtMg00810-like [Tanacetum cinerariifolium]
SGPKWLFDIDTLTQSMNYQPVVAGNQPNHSAGIKENLVAAFEKLMKDKFQMSSIEELTFFLGLQVKQKDDGIFISQDKYVAKILRKFGLTDGKSAKTPIDTEKPLLKDPDVKRIFRYLKGKPHLGLWYPKDSSFNLVAYSDNDYARASLDRKSTTRGCQFLGCRLISWQCKKQTVVTISSTEAEYVGAASCCAQVDEKDGIGVTASDLKRMHPNRGRIEAIDADEDITLVDMETEVDLDADLHRRIERKDNDNAADNEVNAVESIVFNDEEVTMTMAQPLIKMKAEKARLLDEQMAKRLHDEEVEQAIQEKHLDNIKKYQSLKRKPIFVAQARKNMIVYLKNMAGYKMENFKGMTYDKESFKKLKAVEVLGSHSTQDTSTDDPKEMSEEDVRNILEIILVTEFKVKALQVKYPLIDWEIHSEGSRTY